MKNKQQSAKMAVLLSAVAVMVAALNAVMGRGLPLTSRVTQLFCMLVILGCMLYNYMKAKKDEDGEPPTT